MFAYAAIPHRPRLGNEVEELAYARLLGQQRIALRALIPTARPCASPVREWPHCPILLPMGTWTDADDPALPMR